MDPPLGRVEQGTYSGDTPPYGVYVGPSMPVADYTVTERVYADSASAAFVVAHYQDSGNYYACGLDQNNMAWLGKVLGGSEFQGDYAAFDHGAHVLYTITLMVDTHADGGNGLLRCTVSGNSQTVTLEVNWNYLPDPGRVGFAVQGTGEIKSITVTKP
jgi:hypothetical protein